MKRLSAFLIVAALIVGMTGCTTDSEPDRTPTPTPPVQYNLTISSTEGGSVTAPDEGTSTYEAGAVVDILAEAEEGYQFTGWTGSVGAIADVDAPSTTITMSGRYSITADFAKEIRDWHDLDAIRDNLGGSYVLMNDLDSATAGYEELASPRANQGRGWQPIGYGGWSDGPQRSEGFRGAIDGRGYEIKGLFVNRGDEDYVALLGFTAVGGFIDNVRVMDAIVTGHSFVGGLVGKSDGTVSNSCSGGMVTGHWSVGGLVGENAGTVSNCYSGGSVAGGSDVGGLLGRNWATVLNSHYNYDEVLINGKNIISVGALFGEDFEHWLANDRFLEINDRLSKEGGYYLIENVSDFRQLLTFGQDSSLKFRLTSDLDLRHQPNFYVPYLAGEFDGSNHKATNLRVEADFVAHIGLFGCLGLDGAVNRMGVENADIAGAGIVGSLVGMNLGSVNDSYASGRVRGNYEVGGLVGLLAGGGSLTNSYFAAGSVTCHNEGGGLLGAKWSMQRVSNSYYNYDEVLINTQKTITTGALFREDFDQWLANEQSLDVSERLSQEDGYYEISSVSDLRQLLIFGQDPSLKFRLTADLDLGSAPGFYIPYLAGEFHGSGHRIANMRFTSSSTAQVGLFGYLAPSGKVSHLSVDNVSIKGARCVGGLVGLNDGTVTHCYASGRVTGTWYVGGLVGHTRWGSSVSNSYSTTIVTGNWGVGGLVGSSDHGTVSRSYSTGGVTASRDLGGLVGINWVGTVTGCYSTGKVVGSAPVGGLVGRNEQGTVRNSFWDVETSGMEESDGGTAKTTAEMKDIATFSGAGWNIIAVADPGTRNLSYIWNIVDGVTYPFLSWQSVS